MSAYDYCILGTILLYLVGMVAIGAVLSKRNKKTQTIFLSRRQKIRSACNRDERRGFGYELLAFNGYAGACF